MKQLCYFDLQGTDPTWNLAAEQFVFDALPRDRSYLLLWRNRSAVIIGKHQDAQAEVDLPCARDKGIPVVRRLSGGGAVYHDLGNLNYSIITDAGASGKLDLSLFCMPVLEILRELGIPGELSGRNDMTVGGSKFSGSAQYLRQGRVLHHGTLLFDTDLGMVERVLRVDPEKIRSKGLPSVRSRVTNLRPLLGEEMTLSVFRSRLLEGLRQHNGGELLQFSPPQEAEIEALAESRYRRWDWNFGASPPCDLLRRRRIEGCGTVEARICLQHGRIREISFVGDFFSLEEPEKLAPCFLGLKPERQDYARALATRDPSRYFMGMSREQLLRLLCDE